MTEHPAPSAVLPRVIAKVQDALDAVVDGQPAEAILSLAEILRDYGPLAGQPARRVQP